MDPVKLTSNLSLLILLAITFLSPSGNAALDPLQGYDPILPPGWTHRTPLTISRPTSNPFNGTVSLEIDTQTPIALGYMNPAGDDIRFSRADTLTSIPYYLHSALATKSTIILLKLQNLPPGNTTIYMDYGNPNAFALSDQQLSIEQVNFSRLAGYMTGNTTFRFHLKESNLTILKVKENGIPFVPGKNERYVWKKIYAVPQWNNPACSWAKSEGGWNDCGNGVWNYHASGDNYGAYQHNLQFVGNGRSGYYHHGYRYHYDLVSLSGTYSFSGNDAGSNSLNGQTLTVFAIRPPYAPPPNVLTIKYAYTARPIITSFKILHSNPQKMNVTNPSFTWTYSDPERSSQKKAKFQLVSLTTGVPILSKEFQGTTSSYTYDGPPLQGQTTYQYILTVHDGVRWSLPEINQFTTFYNNPPTASTPPQITPSLPHTITITASGFDAESQMSSCAIFYERSNNPANHNSLPGTLSASGTSFTCQVHLAPPELFVVPDQLLNIWTIFTDAKSELTTSPKTLDVIIPNRPPVLSNLKITW